MDEQDQLALFNLDGSHATGRLSRRTSGRRMSPRVGRQLARPAGTARTPSVLVREFHEVFNLTISESPTLDLADGLIDLRVALIEEEVGELRQAVTQLDLVEVADALGDIVYVVFGAALAFGIDLDRVLAEIHRSNMSKLDITGSPVLRPDGKVLKGPNYSPPNLQPVLFQGPRALVLQLG